jgi:DNA-binding NarL/FixJ family response regulator
MVRVLIVDDQPSFLAIIAEELATLPYLMIAGYARSGREALEQLERLHPDLVLLDITLPDMNGLEVARWIKKHDHSATVVLVSFHDTPAYRAASTHIADGFIAKDTLDTQLLPLIAELFPAPDPQLNGSISRAAPRDGA